MDRTRRLLVFMVRSTRRLAVLVLGCAVTAAGLVMMVTPGPGLVVIIAGLAILATEFTWAEILLERARKQAVRAKNMALRKAGGLRRRTLLGVQVWRRADQRVTEVTVTELVVYGPPVPVTAERSAGAAELATPAAAELSAAELSAAELSATAPHATAPQATELPATAPPATERSATAPAAVHSSGTPAASSMAETPARAEPAEPEADVAESPAAAERAAAERAAEAGRAASRVESLTVVDLTTSIRAAEHGPDGSDRSDGSWDEADDDRQDADGGSRR